MAICVRSAIWRTNMDLSTASRRAKNSDSVITVPRLRVKSRRSLRSGRSKRLRSRLSNLRVSGRASRTRTGLTFTTVSTPSSSMVSPGVTPSPRALRRRRRLWVTPSESVVSSNSSVAELSSVSEPSLPFRLLPLPPLRRRRRNSSFSLSSLMDAVTGSAFSTLAAFATLAVLVVGAAWNNGTGIAAAFLLTFLLSPSTAFLAARLRGALGSSAI